MLIDTAFDITPRLPILTTPERSAINLANPLGPLALLPGTWKGKGFNMIWRPNHTPASDHFLELNLTNDEIVFSESIGAIPNRGLLQEDISMFGLTYQQKISDANTGAGLHVEPGIWASVPKTTDPGETPSVVRMASIPHGTTILAQGTASTSNVNTGPTFKPVSITPFPIGNPGAPIPFAETNLANTTPAAATFRTPAAELHGIVQTMLDNPNSVLVNAVSLVVTEKRFKSVVALEVSSSPAKPLSGGGTSNTSFLQGTGDGPNAQAAVVSSIFWIETIAGPPGHPDIHQLQYSQTVLLNFKGLSWPHVTVGTLVKQ